MPKGFTLIEILITLTLVGILTVITVPNLRKFNQSQDLENLTTSAVQIIRQMQSNAVSGVKCTSTPSVAWHAIIRKGNYETAVDCQDPNNLSTPITTSFGVVVFPSKIILTSSTCGTDSSSKPQNINLRFDHNSLTYACPNRDGGTPNPLIWPVQLDFTNTDNNVTKSIFVEQGGIIHY